jgi:hypothetical protein
MEIKRGKDRAVLEDGWIIHDVPLMVNIVAEQGGGVCACNEYPIELRVYVGNGDTSLDVTDDVDMAETPLSCDVPYKLVCMYDGRLLKHRYFKTTEDAMEYGVKHLTENVEDFMQRMDDDTGAEILHAMNLKRG